MDKKPSNVKERVLYFAKIKGITQEKMCKDIGMTHASFKGSAKNRPLNSNAIEKLLSMFPDLNLDWLINGEGEPTKGESYKILLATVVELSQKIDYYEGVIKTLREEGVSIPVREYVQPEQMLQVAEERTKYITRKKKKKKE